MKAIGKVWNFVKAVIIAFILVCVGLSACSAFMGGGSSSGTKEEHDAVETYVDDDGYIAYDSKTAEDTFKTLSDMSDKEFELADNQFRMYNVTWVSKVIDYDHLDDPACFDGEKYTFDIIDVLPQYTVSGNVGDNELDFVGQYNGQQMEFYCRKFGGKYVLTWFGNVNAMGGIESDSTGNADMEKTMAVFFRIMGD